MSCLSIEFALPFSDKLAASCSVSTLHVAWASSPCGRLGRGNDWILKVFPRIVPPTRAGSPCYGRGLRQSNLHPVLRHYLTFCDTENPFGDDNGPIYDRLPAFRAACEGQISHRSGRFRRSIGSMSLFLALVFKEPPRSRGAARGDYHRWEGACQYKCDFY